MSERSRGAQPEAPYLEEMQAADTATLAALYSAYPPPAREDYSNAGHRLGEYWGLAIAKACADAGLSLGFESDTSGSPRIVGSKEAVNYWLYLTGYELRPGNIPDDQSRSGIKTVLSNPVHGQLFNHMFAVHNNVPIEAVMPLDPMFSAQEGQAAAQYEIIDHQGFQNLYDENPEQCVRLYLTRQLPHLANLRATTRAVERQLELNEQELRDNPGTIRRDGIIKTPAARQQDILFLRRRVNYWSMDHDFTVDLLQAGNKPYSLEDIFPLAEAYVATILATRPELHPAQTTTPIPDIKKEVLQLLTDLERRTNADQN